MVGPFRITSEEFTYSKTAPPELRGTRGVSWRVADTRDGDRWVASVQTEAAAIECAERRIREEQPVEIVLADGRTVTVPRGGAERFRGLDRHGHQVYALEEGGDYTFAVTPCCKASAKGGFGGIVCRACYVDVDAYFGGPAEVAVGLGGDGAQLYPTGRFLYYEGDDHEGFVRTVREEFGFDPSDPQRPQRNQPNHGLPVLEYRWDEAHGWSFFCPPAFLDALTARFPLGT